MKCHGDFNKLKGRLVYFSQENPENRYEKRNAEILPEKKIVNTLKESILKLAVAKAKNKIGPEENEVFENLKKNGSEKLKSAVSQFNSEKIKTSANLAKICADYMKDWWNSLNLSQKEIMINSRTEFYEPTNLTAVESLKVVVVVKLTEAGPKIDLAVG